MTVGRPSCNGVIALPMPGDVEQRHPDEPDVSVDVGADREQVGHRLAGDVGVREERALRPACGAGRVHDQRGRLVGDVHRMRCVAWLRDQVVVADDLIIVAAGDDHGLKRRVDVTHGGGHLGQHGFGDHHPGPAVADQKGDLWRGHPEVDRYGDRAELVGREERLDELGAVEHQDQHAVAEVDAAPAQRTGQRGHPAIEISPGRRVTEEPQRCGIGLHQRVPCKLGSPVLSARQMRLLGK
jgi:hypothetical protein